MTVELLKLIFISELPSTVSLELHQHLMASREYLVGLVYLVNNNVKIMAVK